MTQDQSDRLIEKALGDPRALTASEADAIMADPELRDLISTAALLKAAAQPAPDCDVEAEWQVFRRRRWGMENGKWKMKNAVRWAAVIAVAICAAAAFFGLRPSRQTEQIAETEPADTLVLVIKAEEPLIAEAPKPKPVVAKKAPAAIDAPDEEIDPRVLQARIDNEIALMRAECYREIAAAKDIDLPEGVPAIPALQIDGPELSFITAQ